jgi:S1-C subfamily serine protease
MKPAADLKTIFLATLAAAAVIALAGVGAGGVGRGAAAPQAAPAPAAAKSLQQQFVRIVRSVSPSVVQIESTAGLGSGVIYDRAGHVVTNAHVVGDADRFRVTLSDGRRLQGTLVGRFVPDDLAVVKVSATGLQPLPLASSARVDVGQMSLAVGNPLGLRSSVTEGIVSAVGRTITEPNGAVLPNVVQTSAAINPGNSGGALVDLDGKLIGVPTAGAEGGDGIGFAIASDRVRLIADQLIRNGRVVNSGRAILGIHAGAVADDRGVVVADVVAGGPAAAAGIRPGDVITTVGGRPTPTPGDLLTVLATRKPGDTVGVRLLREGAVRQVQVKLGELPAHG